MLDLTIIIGFKVFPWRKDNGAKSYIRKCGKINAGFCPSVFIILFFADAVWYGRLVYHRPVLWCGSHYCGIERKSDHAHDYGHYCWTGNGNHGYRWTLRWRKSYGRCGRNDWKYRNDVFGIIDTHNRCAASFTPANCISAWNATRGHSRFHRIFDNHIFGDSFYYSV